MNIIYTTHCIAVIRGQNNDDIGLHKMYKIWTCGSSKKRSDKHTLRRTNTLIVILIAPLLGLNMKLFRLPRCAHSPILAML